MRKAKNTVRPASAAADAGRAPRPSLALFGSLRYNYLGPQGGAALAKGLEGNATLTSLECAAMPCTCHIRKVLGLADQRQQPLTLVGLQMSLTFLVWQLASQ